MIQLTKRGILAKKLLHGMCVISALCGFEVWYQDYSKASTVALAIRVLQSVLYVLFEIFLWTGVESTSSVNADEMALMYKHKINVLIFGSTSSVSFVTYTVFGFAQFKNFRICGTELRRIYKNFEKFGIDMRSVSRDFCLFMILSFAVVNFGLQAFFDHIVGHKKMSIWNVCMEVYLNMTNVYIDFTFIGAIYLLYLLYKALNEECALIKEVSDSIRYQIAIVKFIREQHQHLASLTQSIVNMYKYPLIISIMRVIVISIIRMYHTFDLPPGLTESDITWEVYGMMIFICLHTFRIFIMCSICTLMKYEANRTNTVLSEVETNNPYLYMRHERANLSLYLMQQNVKIRPCNMFEIDNGLFFSVIGAILVYLFYFVHISQEKQ